MPGFRQKLSDADIADIVEYLRKSRTTQPAWSDMQGTVARIRAGTAPSP
jgi:mono/diheme cytochrome c family protein